MALLNNSHHPRELHDVWLRPEFPPYQEVYTMSHLRQIEMVMLDQLVAGDHPYRRILDLIDLSHLCEPIASLDNAGRGANGFGIVTLFQCLLLQFMEDLSDRELQRYLQENVAAKFFCGFALTDTTPDYSLFTKVRSRIGTKSLSDLFATLRDQLQAKGWGSEVFTFVDATHLISKAKLWQERDKAIAAGYEKLNNESLPKVAVDKDARIGCKGKNKFWYGYKQHTSVDMQSGLIQRIAITAGNVSDALGLKHVCPRSGAVYADKGYCTQLAQREIARRGCHDGCIKRNNMKGKNRDKDRWISSIRGPFERVFSKRNPRVRYRGRVKNQFAAFMGAMCFNLKRLLVLEAHPLWT